MSQLITQRHSWAAALAVSLAVAVAGCGGSSSRVSTKPSKTSPGTPGPQTLPPSELGTYVRHRTSSQFGFSVALTLSPDGHYEQTLAGFSAPTIHGVWSSHDGTITFTETGGKQAECVGQGGTYRWSYANEALTLKAVKESCPARYQDFQLEPFTKRS